MSIGVVWFWDRASEIWDNWRDGYRAAFEVIAKDHKVDWFLDKKLPDKGYDYIHVWDDSNSQALRLVRPLAPKIGLSLTTDPHNFENMRLADVIFAESDPVVEAVRRQGLRVIKAFGTDTDYFYPKDCEKDIEYFYPATFSPWKRQDELSYLGDKITMIGTIQPDGQEIYEKCKASGCKIEVGYFPVEKIRDYYWRTKQILIPAVHGSERTVLEAMSMNIPVQITHIEVNRRADSYIKEQHQSGLTPRDFTIKNYSHEVMAKNLLRGIL